MNSFGFSYCILDNIFSILLYFRKHLQYSLAVFFGKLSKWLTPEYNTQWENRVSLPLL